MSKIKKRFINILYWVIIITADIFVFLILGVLLMGYDDNYDPSKGEYWSLTTMNTTEKVIYICFNAWILINMVVVLYIAYKAYKRIKYGT